MSLEEAREPFAEALTAHMTQDCDPLICPWCHGDFPDVEDFEPEEEDRG